MATMPVNTGESPVTLRNMLPVISASTLGTAIEWFDFFFYGFLSVTVFPAVFFPKLDPFAGIIASFGANFVGFVARPLGGAFFGWFGDRIGRRATLAATLLLMGIATILIGILPGYATIGIAAPLLLSLLRFLQGIGLGGEWGGSVLLSLEYSDDRHRGFWTSWPQTGVAIGLGLSVLSVLLFKSLFPGDAFESIGWRIPFLQSSVLVIVGLYIRLRIMETPAFTKVKHEQRISKAPLLDVFRYNWREILLCSLARSGETASFYIFTAFVFSYAVQVAKLDLSLVYTGLALSSVVGFALMPLFALIFSFGVCVSWLYGPEAALISERFNTRLRYSGASLGYQLASITAGGPAPIIATYLLANYKTFGSGFAAAIPSYTLIALYIILISMVSLVAVQFLKEYAGKPVAADGV
jgi:MFS family permease